MLAGMKQGKQCDLAAGGWGSWPNYTGCACILDVYGSAHILQRLERLLDSRNQRPERGGPACLLSLHSRLQLTTQPCDLCFAAVDNLLQGCQG